MQSLPYVYKFVPLEGLCIVGSLNVSEIRVTCVGLKEKLLCTFVEYICIVPGLLCR